MARNTPLLLAILDGWGVAPPGPGNAVALARTPNMDRWLAQGPATTLTAHNGAVGLPEGQMGNSEVGHLNIGAGRIVYQDFTRINLAVRQGDFFRNPALTGIMDLVREQDSSLHLMGLLSDGGVHSHIDHLLALVRMAAERGVEHLYLHCFMDGRDTPPSSGLGYMRTLTAALADIDRGRVATISGRYWAMDRDNRWERVERAWQAMVRGKGRTAVDPLVAVETAYAAGETDEFITPTVLVDDQKRPLARIRDRDGVIFFNFRADRARELCHALADKDFSAFPAPDRPRLARLVTMTEYEADFPFPVAFPPLSMDRILGAELAAHGIRQLRIAETEKYAHVTYFFNGGREAPFPGEERLLIDSPRDVATYDLKPEMSARAVTDTLLATLEKAEQENAPLEVIILNFANGDMVGHTGVLPAAIRACETVDDSLGRIREAIRARDGIMVITADHGNAEMMINPETGEPYTAHTLNPVPLLLVGEPAKKFSLRDGGALRDIAPTLLDLLGLPVPEEMDGKSLLNRLPG